VIEWHEDFLTAGIREVLEETSVQIDVDSILTVSANFFDPERHTIAVVLLGHPVAGEPQGDGVETDAARWFSSSDPLPELAFEGDRHIIERYFAQPFTGAPVDPRYARS
jgi:8-oxo-dGTP diphosphatase